MRAERAGADAVLSVVPYYNKPMQEGIAAHFRAIAASTALPVILHDIPARTVRPLADETIAFLAQSRQFVGLKDGTGDVSRPTRLSRWCRPAFACFRGRRHCFRLYCRRGSRLHFTGFKCYAGLCRAIFSNLSAGPAAISAAVVIAVSARRIACLSNAVPAALEICAEPARIDASQHPFADRGAG